MRPVALSFALGRQSSSSSTINRGARIIGAGAILRRIGPGSQGGGDGSCRFSGARPRGRGGPMQNRVGVVRGVIGAALLTLLLGGAAQAVEVGQRAPDFALNGIDGKPVK